MLIVSFVSVQNLRDTWRKTQMKLKILSAAPGSALIAILLFACSVIAENRKATVDDQTTHTASVVTDNEDPISGEWNVTFFVHK